MDGTMREGKGRKEGERERENPPAKEDQRGGKSKRSKGQRLPRLGRHVRSTEYSILDHTIPQGKMLKTASRRASKEP